MFQKILMPRITLRDFLPKRPDGEGFTKADFRKAMEALFARSIIIVSTYQGSNRHEHEEIGRNPNVGARSALGSL